MSAYIWCNLSLHCDILFHNSIEFCSVFENWSLFLDVEMFSTMHLGMFSRFVSVCTRTSCWKSLRREQKSITSACIDWCRNVFCDTASLNDILYIWVIAKWHFACWACQATFCMLGCVQFPTGECLQSNKHKGCNHSGKRNYNGDFLMYFLWPLTRWLWVYQRPGVCSKEPPVPIWFIEHLPSRIEWEPFLHVPCMLFGAAAFYLWGFLLYCRGCGRARVVLARFCQWLAGNEWVKVCGCSFDGSNW